MINLTFRSNWTNGGNYIPRSQKPDLTFHYHSPGLVLAFPALNFPSRPTPTTPWTYWSFSDSSQFHLFSGMTLQTITSRGLTSWFSCLPIARDGFGLVWTRFRHFYGQANDDRQLYHNRRGIRSALAYEDHLSKDMKILQARKMLRISTHVHSPSEGSPIVVELGSFVKIMLG